MVYVEVLYCGGVDVWRCEVFGGVELWCGVWRCGGVEV